jgi:hypothetical protein
VSAVTLFPADAAEVAEFGFAAAAGVDLAYCARHATGTALVVGVMQLTSYGNSRSEVPQRSGIGDTLANTSGQAKAASEYGNPSGHSGRVTACMHA